MFSYDEYYVVKEVEQIVQKRYSLDLSQLMADFMWTSKRSKNVEKMYEMLQDLYVGRNGEVSIVFSSLKPVTCCCDYEYDVSDATPTKNRVDGEWMQDISSSINKHLVKYGIDVHDFSTANVRLSVWHNHHAGTGFSTADMILIVDFYPIINEAFLDVNYVQWITPTSSLKKMLIDEVFKSEYLQTLIEMRNGLYSNPSFREEREGLDKEYLPNLFTYFKLKEQALDEGRAFYDEMYVAIYEEYDEKLRKIVGKYESEFIEVKNKFISVNITKKEV